MDNGLGTELSMKSTCPPWTGLGEFPMGLLEADFLGLHKAIGEEVFWRWMTGRTTWGSSAAGPISLLLMVQFSSLGGRPQTGASTWVPCDFQGFGGLFGRGTVGDHPLNVW